MAMFSLISSNKLSVSMGISFNWLDLPSAAVSSTGGTTASENKIINRHEKIDKRLELKIVFLHMSNMLRTFSVAIANRMMDALSNCSISCCGTGNASDSSVKISVSRERRHRAASRDFSLRFSLFL